MKDVQMLCAVLGGVLAIALIAAAGIYFDVRVAVKLAMLAGGGLYLVQLADAIAAQLTDPVWQLALYRACVVIWIIAATMSIIAMMLIVIK